MNESFQSIDGSFGCRRHHSRIDPAQESTLVGWRFPRNLVAEIKELAAAGGERPRVFVSRILREQLVMLNRPLSTAQVEELIRARRIQ